MRLESSSLFVLGIHEDTSLSDLKSKKDDSFVAEPPEKMRNHMKKTTGTIKAEVSLLIQCLNPFQKFEQVSISEHYRFEVNKSEHTVAIVDV